MSTDIELRSRQNNNNYKQFTSASSSSSKAIDDEVRDIRGYVLGQTAHVLWIVLVVLTAGFAWLYKYWYPGKWVMAWATPVNDLGQAELIVVIRRVDQGDPFFAEKVIVAELGTQQGYMGRRLSASGFGAERGQSEHHGSFSSLVHAPTLASCYGSQTKAFRYFIHRHVRYIFNDESRLFEPSHGFDDGYTFEELQALSGQFHENEEARYALFAYHGHNEITVEVKPYLALLFQEVLNPFYLFQLFAVILWCFELYYYYSGVLFFMSAVTCTVNLIETRRNMETLSRMVHFKGEVNLLTSSNPEQVKEVPSTYLVPGDIFLIPKEGLTLSCDAVLLSGGCVVNESMLTGESVPVSKQPLPKESEQGASVTYNTDTHKSYTLYCGTKVLQTRGADVKAMVIRTGFRTAKGELVRSILFPKPSKFSFYRDALLFVGALCCVAALGFLYTALVFKYRNGETVGIIFLRGLDLITTIVPPALPAAMTIGTVYAMSRLKEKKIFCISPLRVNVAGKIKMMCFDKTGTLTEDGLDVWGVHPASGQSFDNVQENPVFDVSSPLFRGLATCHSLTRLDHGSELIGDPLEVKLFDITHWVLEEAEGETHTFTLIRPPSSQEFSVMARKQDALIAASQPISEDEPDDLNIPILKDLPSFPSLDDEEEEDQPRARKATLSFNPLTSYQQLPGSPGLAIAKRFAFSSQLQRMSVVSAELRPNWKDVAQPFQNEMWAYAKGAPEVIKELCLAKSVPADYDAQLREYTQRGFRVLALASKRLGQLSLEQVKAIGRGEVEASLTFEGFLIMENRLKPQTPLVLETLENAAIRSVMVTGDNILTACSVARSSGLVQSDSPMFIVKVVPAVELGDKLSSSSTPFVVQLRSVDESPNIDVSDRLALTGLEHVRIMHHPSTPLAVLPGRPFTMESVLQGRQRIGLAIEGKDFALLKEKFPEDYKRVIVGGAVFARTTPEQKAELVEDLQALGYNVGMCGDGANDCGALKAANVGISLSEAEASIAAPFTSQTPDIRCVPQLIREGRCALTTSFCAFKFMALYSFTEFTTVMIFYWVGSNLGNFQYLYIDLFIILSLVFTLGRTGPYSHLVKQRPLGRLLSPLVMVSLVGMFIIQCLAQTILVLVLKDRPWFSSELPYADDDMDYLECQENTILFSYANFLYLGIAIAISTSRPYRKSMLTNYYLVGSLIVLFAFTLFVAIDPTKPLKSFFQFVPFENSFRGVFVPLAIGFSIICIFFERFIGTSRATLRFYRKIFPKTKYKNEYKYVAESMIEENWPSRLLALPPSTRHPSSSYA